MEKKEGRGREATAAPRAPHLNIKHTGGDKILAGGRRRRQRRRLVFHGKNGQSCLNHDAAAVRASASSVASLPRNSGDFRFQESLLEVGGGGKEGRFDLEEANCLLLLP